MHLELHTERTSIAYASFMLIAVVLTCSSESRARPSIRSAFFDAYPSAVGTAIETIPSQPNHCGVCHYEFTGGGPRNPYGVRLGEVLGDFPNNPNGRRQAVLSIENEDPDGDGFSTLTEVTDTTTFGNTPTFPGLTPSNVGNVTSVNVTEIQQHLVPSTGDDTTPPDVTVIAPNGGETLVGNSGFTVQWSATDVSGVAGIDLYLSDDGGGSFKPIALGLANTGSHTWFPANRPTTFAVIRAVATDNAFNTGHDDSDSFFTIESPPGGLVPTTLRDFDQPGSQPFEAGILNPPEACAVCHGNYDANVEPYFNWQGSMMANASLDPLFEANMAIANQDAPDSGDLCLRCHIPRGWLQGRSVPTDGSQMLDTDKSGVSCDFCHRLVDPIYDPQANPPEDQAVLAALSFPATNFGNGMATIDPTGARRGPFLNASTGHPVLVSPFHREAALCGTCHDVSNPAFEKDGNGNYVPNAFDTTATDFSAHTLAPVERTYSEWFYSEYNTSGGVYAPEFGGNLDFVSTCQDCHMRDVTGEGCNFGTPPTRTDLPLHDITGGSAWLPGLLGTLYPGEVNEAALQAGISRARYMLQHAADLTVTQEGAQLKVTVTNNTGHKLPTGYPEGRRMWLNVKFYDATMTLVSESAAYDSDTGVLSHDAEAKIYDIEPGLDEVTAPIVGVDPGPSFHFVLNNKIFKDNRIPPRGFTNAAYADFGGAPVAYSYADGQHWDDTFYSIPGGAASAEVTLYYQSTSKEFIEFLRDENTTNTKGQEIHDLWSSNGKCPPEIMQTSTLALAQCSSDAECDDGLYCNGTETCDGNGECQPGTPVDCNDGVDCTVDSCNETTDSCDNPPNNGFCDDGLYCTGTETCDAVLGCQAGTPVDCTDGAACTVDSCNETTDSCDNVPDDDFCDNGLYCDGAETCDPVNDCLPGTPVDCTDTVACTVDSCNETTDSCDHAPDDGFCDNALYCDGAETCDPVNDCQPGTPVDCTDTVDCTVDSCNETTDSCDQVPDDGFCDNELYCDGAETCDPVNDCQPGTPVDCTDAVACTVDSCNETTDSCDHAPDDGFCDNALYCDGGETCDPVDDCQPGSDPCPGDLLCDEVNDRCYNCTTDTDCDDGLYCNGTERCDAEGNCQPGIAVDCSDGIACTADSCDEAVDDCQHLPDDSLCDNGLYCDGAEACDSELGCQAGADPCTPDLLCDESNDRCVNCLTAGDCDNGLYCDGAETCDATGSCRPGIPVDCSDGIACTIDSCNEATDSCDHSPDDVACDDGLFCTGIESCDLTLGCLSSGDPCQPDDICNEDADQCEAVCPVSSPPIAALPDAGFGTATRYLSIRSGDPGRTQAIRVVFADLEPPYDAWNGVQMWVQEPTDYCEKAGEDTPPCSGATWKGATLDCTPYYRDWSTLGTVYVSHEGIIPKSSYTIQVIDETCDANNPSSYSAALFMDTSRMGDCCGNPASNPPNGAAELPDVISVLQKFANDASAPIKARLDHATVGSVENVDQVISLPDVIAPLQGFANLPYPGTPSVGDPCPGTAMFESDGPLVPISAGAPVEAVIPVHRERIASLRLVPDQTVVAPGRLVTVDVFVDHVDDMQGYQLALDVSGGNAGVLAVEDLWIDPDRADYAFPSGDALDAVDLDGRRLLAVQMRGGMAIASAAYLGSFQLRASDDAAGEFTIDLRWDDTLLMTPAGELIRATVDGPASMRVEPKVPQRRPTSR